MVSVPKCNTVLRLFSVEHLDSDLRTDRHVGPYHLDLSGGMLVEVTMFTRSFKAADLLALGGAGLIILTFTLLFAK